LVKREIVLRRKKISFRKQGFERKSRLDGGHVVFGRVKDHESRKIVKKVESFGSQEGNPTARIVIDKCQCQ